MKMLKIFGLLFLILTDQNAAQTPITSGSGTPQRPTGTITGETSPLTGETPPLTGETPPLTGETPPLTGETPPLTGETPPPTPPRTTPTTTTAPQPSQSITPPSGPPDGTTVLTITGTPQQTATDITTTTTTTTSTTTTTTTTTAPQPSEGDIRLAGGQNQYEGRVEIYHNGQWGTVCDDKFGENEAAVVCFQLGFATEGAIVGSPTDKFGPGEGQIWLDELGCIGNERRLAECPHNNWKTDCSHSEDIGVECKSQAPQTTTTPLLTGSTSSQIFYGYGNCTTNTGNIRLVGPRNQPNIGVVQYNDGRGWATVCDDSFQTVEAKVVCSQLCFTDTTRSLAGLVAFDTSAILEPVSQTVYDCQGGETSLDQCPTRTGNCGPTERAVVTCDSCVECDFQPSRPRPILECDNGNITIKFDSSENPYLFLGDLNVVGSGNAPCNPNKYQDLTHLVISIPFEECDTQRRVNATHISYSNTIVYGPTNSPGSMIISNEHIIHATCEIPRSTNVHKPFVPITDVINISEVGEFNAKITYYNDWGFTVPVTQFPLQVASGTYILAAVELEEQDPDLKLVVPTCFTTPSNYRNHSINWPLFDNKCPDEPSVRLFSLADKVFGFCMQAFKFVGFPEVHVHCDAFVCTRDDAGDECDRTCGAGRKKRSSISAHKKFSISSKVVVVETTLTGDDVEEIVQSPAVVTYQPDRSSSEPPATKPPATTPETSTPATETTSPTKESPTTTGPETTENPTKGDNNKVNIEVDVDVETIVRGDNGSDRITLNLSVVTVLLAVYRFL